MADKEKPVRGLPSIHEARTLRGSRLLPRASGSFWLWSLVGVAALTIFYWKKTQSETDAHRARVLAKQRGVDIEVGPIYRSLRDKVERWTVETATGKDTDDVIAPELKTAGDGDPEVFKKPAVYLRLAQPHATDAKAIRAASANSLRDAFTSCLLRTPHLDSHKGKACERSRECTPGEFCNEVGVCARPTQPYNMRVAYKGLKSLSEDWVRDVETTTEPLRLRVREAEIDDASVTDIPIAIELLKRAQHVLIVIDEVPQGVKTDPEKTLEQVVQSEVHPARVALYRLQDDKLLFRARRTIDVTIPAIPTDAETIEAQRRQILNCALAQEVRAALK